MQMLETPPAQLTREGFVFILTEIIGSDFFHKEFLVEYFPRAAVGHPGDDVGIRGVGQYHV